jgi:glycosyltransferase involved in cell wall biosynthesis
VAATRGLDVTRKPCLSIGLPIYNGEAHLAQSLDALLGQTFEDFELILSSNASTSMIDDICRAHAAHDQRIRFLRHRTNIAAAPNHNWVLAQSQPPAGAPSRGPTIR